MKQPSDKLLELARQYLMVVGGSPDSENDPFRTELHELLMNQLEEEHYPFQSRVEARWIARWLVRGSVPATDYGELRIMWAELNYLNGTIKALHSVPADDNASGWVPVLVVPLPYDASKAERSI